MTYTKASPCTLIGNLQVFKEAWVCSLYLLEKEAEQRPPLWCGAVDILFLGGFKPQSLSTIDDMI